MLKIGKQNLPTHVDLPQMSEVPGIDDLQFLYSKAQRNWRCSVQLPWKTDEINALFTINVKCDLIHGQPCWSLYKEDEAGCVMVWSYASPDVYLIHNLIHMECKSGGTTGQLPPETGLVDPAAASQMRLSSESVKAVYFQAEESKAEAAKTASVSPGGQLHPKLEGDLKNLQMPNLLQSMTMSKMTGRLELHRKAELAEIDFEDGVPVHAWTGDATGDTAVIELLTWEDGAFRFFEGETSLNRTIKRRMENLLMEGITLLDQTIFLNNAGLHSDSYLLRQHEELTADEFAALLTDGAPIELSLQRKFYERIDNRSTLSQILRNQPMTICEWAPIVFNLINAEIIGLADTICSGESNLPPPVMIEPSVSESIVRSLSRLETGILTCPALLYFLEQEYLRFQRGGLPFSLIIFEICLRDSSAADGLSSIPAAVVKEAALKINSAKRALDYFAHYETFDFALLLPHTYSDGAYIFAKRIAKLLTSQQLLPNLAMDDLVCFFGVAGIPDDCSDAGTLLAVAEKAKAVAKEKRQPVVMFSEYAKMRQAAENQQS